MSTPAGDLHTFLFTDIEGSIRLWEENRQEMSEALRQHEQLLYTTMAACGGEVFKTVGDAFCCRFACADQAVQAALSAQQQLLDSNRERLLRQQNALQLRVRMALNTGVCETRSGDYFGPAVNRVARLLAAAHGGQVLLSQSTCAAVAAALPENATVRFLGEHHLRDLQQPEFVYQLLHPDLPDQFPSLRSLEAFTHNLPTQLSSFIGREQAIQRIRELLQTTRLLTLTGPGGGGKTRLALQAAVELLDDYTAGVWFVDLTLVREASAVPRAVLAAVGVREEPHRNAVQTLAQSFLSRPVLLVLDNCEHLSEACAVFVEGLLRSTLKAQVLTTSRVSLGVMGETVWQVPLLTVPAPQQSRQTEPFAQFEAVRLFVERARAIRPDFLLNAENTESVAEICRRLDGIPLAIELAAARLRALSPAQIVTHLDQALRLLTGVGGRRPGHHHTLRATIEWSVQLLPAQERTLLARLSVFAGGWTLEAAEQVCASEELDAWGILDSLDQLVDRSLVMVTEVNGTTRYRLLEVVRQFMAELLTSNETALLQQRHANYYLNLAETLEPKLTGAEQTRWLDQLEMEFGNLRAALRYFQGQDASDREPEGIESGLRLAGALWWFWYVRGYFVEGLEALEAALARRGKVAPKVRAKALHAVGSLVRNQGDYARAQRLFEEALTIRREIQDWRGQASTLYSLGLAAQNNSDIEAARCYFEEALRLNRNMGNREWEGAVLNSLGVITRLQGDYVRARALSEESRALYLAFGDRLGVANAINSLGMVAYYTGDYEQAHHLFQEVLQTQRDLRNKRGIASTLENIGNVALACQNWAAARAPFEETVQLTQELGNRCWQAISLCRLGIVEQGCGNLDVAEAHFRQALALSYEPCRREGIAAALEGLARVRLVQQRAEKAAVLWGAAQALYQQSSVLRPPPEVAQSDALRAQIASVLEPDVLESALEEGGCVSWERALLLAET